MSPETCFANYTEQLKHYVQNWWRVDGWGWNHSGSLSERDNGIQEGVKDGVWGAEVEEQARDIAKGVFKFPLLTPGSKVKWTTLAELRQGEAAAT